MTQSLVSALLLSAALAACGPFSPPSSPASSHGTAQTTAQDPMIDLVRDLAQYATQSARSVDDLIAHLGTAQPATGAAVQVVASDPRLRGARITRLPSGAPFTITLQLARSIRVAELTAAFGAYQIQEASEPGMPWPLLFHSVVQGSVARVSLIIEVPGSRADLDHHEVTAITLRIDPPSTP